MRTRTIKSSQHERMRKLSRKDQRRNDEPVQLTSHLHVHDANLDDVDKNKGKEARCTTPKAKMPKLDHRGLVQTPGRDDWMCSQHFDSQVVVDWNCNSPDAIKNIKKSSSNASDLIVKLSANYQDDNMAPRSMPPLLGVWRVGAEDQGDRLLPNRFRRRGFQKRKNAKTSVDSHDLLQTLTLALDGGADADKETEQRACEGEILLSDDTEDENKNDICKLNCSSDLFDTSINTKENADINVMSVRVSPRLLEKKRKKDIEQQLEQECSSVGADFTEVAWSDDELFEEDSFIIKATQLPTDDIKFISPIFGNKRKNAGESLLPNNKCSRYVHQIGNKNQASSAHCQTLVNISTKSCGPQTSSVNTKYASTNTVNHSNTEKVVSKLSSGQKAVQPLIFAETKPSISPRENQSIPSTLTHSNVSNFKNVSTLVPKATVSSQAVNCSTKVQCLSVNSVGQSSVTSTPVFSKPQTTSTNRKLCGLNSGNVTTVYNALNFTQEAESKNIKTFEGICQQNLNRSNSFKKHNSFSDHNPVKNNMSFVRKRSVSGDDINMQGGSAGARNVGVASVIKLVVGTDENFYPENSKSAKNVTSISSSLNLKCTNSREKNAVEHLPSTISVMNHIYKQSCVPTSSESVSAKSLSLSCVENKSNDMHKETTLRSFDTSLSDDLLCQLAEPDDMLDSQLNVIESSQNQSITKVNTTPLQTVTCITTGSTIATASNNSDQNKQYLFKESQQNKECKLKESWKDLQAELSNPFCDGPRDTKDITIVNHKHVPDVYSEDLFASDDELTEPQIIAFLEQAEVLASQMIDSQKSISEQETNLIGSQGKLQGSQVEGSSSQSRLPGSPTKYTPAEIERKKLEALERRKLRCTQTTMK